MDFVLFNLIRRTQAKLVYLDTVKNLVGLTGEEAEEAWRKVEPMILERIEKEFEVLNNEHHN